MTPKKLSQTTATAPTAPMCEECIGPTYIITDEGAVPCKCMVDLAMESRLTHARIPKKFLKKNFENFSPSSKDQEAIKAECGRFVEKYMSKEGESRYRGLLMIGKEGTGKTHLAVGILNRAIRDGYLGMYWNVPELFLELRRAMNADTPESEAEIFDTARRVDLLVLDDLGAEKSSEYVNDRLYVLINGRYESDKATIITTNCTRDELKNRIGARIVSRICEMCSALDFPPGDYRMKNLR